MHIAQAEQVVREIKKNIVSDLQKHGEVIDITAVDCERWKLADYVCEHCSFNLGCRKLAKLLVSSQAFAIYRAEEPTIDFEARRQVMTHNDRIFGAKIMHELEAIPWAPLYLELKSEAVRRLVVHMKNCVKAGKIKLVAVQDAPHHRLLLEQEGIPAEQILLCEYPGCFFLGFSVEHESHFLDALWPPGFEVETEVATRYDVHESVLLLKPEKLPGYPQSLARRPMGIRHLYDTAKKQ